MHQADPTDLLCEPPHIAEERRALISQLEILSKAAAVLSRYEDKEERASRTSKISQLVILVNVATVLSRYEGTEEILVKAEAGLSR